MINALINRNINQAAASIAAKVLPQKTAQGRVFEDDLKEAIQNVSSVASSSIQASASIEDAPSASAGGFTRYITVEIDGIKYRQPTDELLTSLGYDVAVLQANAIEIDLPDLVVYATHDMVIPKYVIPLDITNGTDYSRTLATRENLAETAVNNAKFDAWASSRNISTETMGSNITQRPKITEPAVEYLTDEVNVYKEPLQNISGLAEKSVPLPQKTIASVAEDIKSSVDAAENRKSARGVYTPLQNAANISSAKSDAIAAWMQRILADVTMKNLLSRS